MGQRTMPHMECNSSGYIRDFSHCVNFLSTRSYSGTRCDAQETNIRGSVTNTWIRSPSNWNKQCIQFWRVGLRQENLESNIQCIIRWKRDRLPVPTYIRRDPEREQHLIFWIFWTIIIINIIIITYDAIKVTHHSKLLQGNCTEFEFDDVHTLYANLAIRR